MKLTHLKLDMEHWSASRFLCWEQCPAEFYARYIAKHSEFHDLVVPDPG